MVVRVSGVNRSRTIIAEALQDVSREAVKQVVNAGYRTAMQLAPQDTGALKAGIKKNDGTAGKGVARVSGFKRGSVIVYQPKHTDARNRPYHLWQQGFSAMHKNQDGTRKSYDLRRLNYGSKKPDFMKSVNKTMIRTARALQNKKLVKRSG